jgi:exonuclease SbcD
MVPGFSTRGKHKEVPMLARPFRFLHAADLHLEEPVCGLSDIPQHLEEALLEAPWRAARRLVDTAVEEAVDFVLLSGDVIDAAVAGPSGVVRWRRELERLAEHRIAVYWAAGSVDLQSNWPAAARLPAGVHRFIPGRPQEVTHWRDEAPLAIVQGAGGDSRAAVRAAEFRPEPSGLFTIALVPGIADAEGLAARGIHYWALGGEHARRTLSASPQVAHYPGTPQGRSPREAGPHGFTLVSVDESGTAHPRFVAADAVRWHVERIELVPSATGRELADQLEQRLEALWEGAAGRHLLIDWGVVAEGALAYRLRQGVLKDELLGLLREAYGRREPAAYSAALRVESRAAWPANWRDEDSLLGQFLRTLANHAENPQRHPLDLAGFLSEKQLAAGLAEPFQPAGEAERSAVLQEAARLGIDLLNPEAIDGTAAGGNALAALVHRMEEGT